jgi:hypothetical protein
MWLSGWIQGMAAAGHTAPWAVRQTLVSLGVVLPASIRWSSRRHAGTVSGDWTAVLSEVGGSDWIRYIGSEGTMDAGHDADDV